MVLARGGSKGIKDKNLKLLAGIPLIAHSIRQAEECGLFDAVAVSSDDPRILGIAEEYGVTCRIRRPAELAGDAAPKVPAMRHCCLEAEKQCGQTFDIIVDLAVTSPLRSAQDIAAAIAKRDETGAPNVTTASPSEHSPYYNIVELDGQNRIKVCKALERPLLRRQDAPETFECNGAVYVWTRDALMTCGDKSLLEDTVLHIMPRERAIDIDTEVDFELARILLDRRGP